MFEPIFAEIQEKNKDIHLIGIWGRDGLVLEKASFRNSHPLNVDLLGAEVADVVVRINSIRGLPGNFTVEHVADDFKLTILPLNESYFLMVVSSRDLLLTKLRYYIDLYKDRLLSLL